MRIIFAFFAAGSAGFVIGQKIRRYIAGSDIRRMKKIMNEIEADAR